MRLAALSCAVVTLSVAARLVVGDAAEMAHFPLRGSMLHAHNCYPEDGRWTDRLVRALRTGQRPLAIEQDLVWAPDREGGTSVVSHGGPLTGTEPSLEEHFFRKIAPLMQRALRENRRDAWPLVVLHLDFKTNEPAHHRSVWELLGQHAEWLTTAERVADPAHPSPLSPGPLLVLTENGDGQVTSFRDALPIGTRLRLFGTVTSTTASPVPAASNEAARPRDYRRWVNLSWQIVEGVPQPEAPKWGDAQEAILRTLVTATHERGWWIRFYALNGHAPRDSQGWSPGYNFGSLEAVDQRWRAAIQAGVDLIATDQYEALAARLPRPR